MKEAERPSTTRLIGAATIIGKFEVKGGRGGMESGEGAGVKSQVACAYEWKNEEGIPSAVILPNSAMSPLVDL